MVDPGGTHSHVSLSLFILARIYIRTPDPCCVRNVFLPRLANAPQGLVPRFSVKFGIRRKMVVPKVGWGGTYCTARVYESVANSFSPLAAIAVKDEIIHVIVATPL